MNHILVDLALGALCTVLGGALLHYANRPASNGAGDFIATVFGIFSIAAAVCLLGAAFWAVFGPYI